MVDFRSGYVSPGIYVTADSSGSVGSVGVGATVLCLIGTGLGFNTYVESISFAGGNSVLITQQGANTSTVVVTNPVTGALYVLGTDYTVTQTGTGSTTVTTVVRTNGAAIPAGATVSVTYQYTNAAYYSLNLFNDYASFEAVYGAAFDPVTGAITSQLSLAAQIAFQNGANVLYAVALGGTGSVASQFATAYTLLGSNYAINLVVPLFSTAVDGASASSLLTGLTAYLNNAEQDGFPQMAIVGVAQSFTGETPDIIATSLAYRRVVLVWPQSFNFYNPVLNSAQNPPLDGFYFAAACAGVLANQNVNRGLTRSSVSSFTGIPASVLTSMSLTNKNLWSSQGVSVAEMDRNGRILVRHGVTTDISSVQNREITLVRCQDALFELIQVSLNQADLIGDPIISTTALTVKGIIAGSLETALASNVIQGYTNLIVSQQALPGGDPTVIQCVFQYQPTYPLNYITVSFSLDLSTGAIVNTTDTATASTGTSG